MSNASNEILPFKDDNFVDQLTDVFAPRSEHQNHIQHKLASRILGIVNWN